ncbi:MAG: phosphatidylglycerophosphatase A [Candidatus Latescibacterota bacterium]|nr:MAG: phosphatidylglycerophosphatase A [Candidatus Latescibacterota bacterium]
MRIISTAIGTFFFTGFFPVVPATFACLVFSLIYTLVPGGEILTHPLVALATLIVSVPISTYLEKRYGRDARCIVIDEVVGMQIVLVFALPTTLGIVVAFFLFRFFDIAKPFPVGRSQNLPAGWGVVCDDFLAGVYARVTLIVIAWVVPAIGRFV